MAIVEERAAADISCTFSSFLLNIVSPEFSSLVMSGDERYADVGGRVPGETPKRF